MEKPQPLFSVLVTTRNRTPYLALALKSIKEQDFEDLEVVVSDNSSPEEAEKNRALIADCGLANLRYVRPERELAMALHWEWAIDQTRGRYVGLLSDRTVFKRGALAQLAARIRETSIDVVSSPCDWVNGEQPPYFLIQKPYSGQLMNLSSAGFLDTVRRLDRVPWYCVPRMMNCFARREVLEQMKARYGHRHLSISPDFYFGFLVMDHLPQFHYWDYPMYTHYALGISNGFSFKRGDKNGTVQDYLALLAKDGLSYEPLPDGLPWIWTVLSSVLIEYERVRGKQTSGRFKPVDKQRFYLVVADEVARQIRSGMREDNERALEAFRLAHGLAPEPLSAKVRRAAEVFATTPFAMSVIHPLVTGLVARLGAALPFLTRMSTVAGRFDTYETALAHNDAKPRPANLAPAFDPRALGL